MLLPTQQNIVMFGTKCCMQTHQDVLNVNYDANSHAVFDMYLENVVSVFVTLTLGTCRDNMTWSLSR